MDKIAWRYFAMAFRTNALRMKSVRKAKGSLITTIKNRGVLLSTQCSLKRFTPLIAVTKYIYGRKHIDDSLREKQHV